MQVSISRGPDNDMKYGSTGGEVSRVMRLARWNSQLEGKDGRVHSYTQITGAS